MVARLKLVMGAQGRLTVGRVLLWIVGLWLAYMWILPFVWMVSTSFKLPGEVMTQTIEWIPRTWTLDNYRVVFQKPIVRWLWNSMVVTTSITLASIMLGAAAGYALARMNFPGRNVFFMMLLLSLMIPTEMTIVPRFIAFLRLRATDSYAALILPPIAEVFSVYLFRQFFLSLPRELEEAAAMDGASRFRIFRVIALPLARATVDRGGSIAVHHQLERLPLAVADHLLGRDEDAAHRHGGLCPGDDEPDPDRELRARHGGDDNPGRAQPDRVPLPAALLHGRGNLHWHQGVGQQSRDIGRAQSRINLALDDQSILRCLTHSVT